MTITQENYYQQKLLDNRIVEKRKQLIKVKRSLSIVFYITMEYFFFL